MPASTDFDHMAHRAAGRLIAVGASTGGVEALEIVLRGLPPVCPPIVIALHIPKRFSAAFAGRLDKLSALNVQEAKEGLTLTPGMAVVAPGDRHLRVRRAGHAYRVVLGDDPPIGRHRPSVNALFQSVAREAGKRAIGVILTGMGGDGADGLKDMRDAGAMTFGQNADTCVVYGMPKAAKHKGGVIEELPLCALPNAIAAALTAPQGG